MFAVEPAAPTLMPRPLNPRRGPGPIALHLAHPGIAPVPASCGPTVSTSCSLSAGKKPGLRHARLHAWSGSEALDRGGTRLWPGAVNALRQAIATSSACKRNPHNAEQVLSPMGASRPSYNPSGCFWDPV